MTTFQKRVECRVCETRMIVTFARNHDRAGREARDTEGCVFCPICDSTVSFDLRAGLDASTAHIRNFEYDAEAARRRARQWSKGGS